MEIPLSAPLLPARPLEAPQSHWSKCRKFKLFSSITATAVSIAATIFFDSQMSTINTLASIGIGIGIQSTINTCFSNDSVLRIQQVASTFFRKTSIFCIPFFLPCYFPGLQTVALTGIGVMLGANATAHIKQYLDTPSNRMNVAPPPDLQTTNASASCPIITPNTPILPSFANAAICVTGLGFAGYAMRGMARNSFLFCLFICQGFSQWVCNKVVDMHFSKEKEKINAAFQNFKEIVNRAAPLAIPLVWIFYKQQREIEQRKEMCN